VPRAPLDVFGPQQAPAPSKTDSGSPEPWGAPGVPSQAGTEELGKTKHLHASRIPTSPSRNDAHESCPDEEKEEEHEEQAEGEEKESGEEEDDEDEDEQDDENEEDELRRRRGGGGGG